MIQANIRHLQRACKIESRASNKLAALLGQDGRHIHKYTPVEQDATMVKFDSLKNDLVAARGIVNDVFAADVEYVWPEELGEEDD